jgi:hypothetical protein
MSSSFSFVGARLSLESVQFLTPLRLRVRFTTDPLAVSSLGAHDALNPSLYTLAGPGVASVQQVIPVPGDPQAFDLVTSGALLTGTWVLTVTAIQTSGASALVSPTVMSFQSLYLTSQDTSPGIVQTGGYELLRKHFNTSALHGPKWTAILRSIGASDDRGFAQARAGFDEAFLASAHGRYLTQRAADRGVKRPQGVGLSDESFRALAIAVSAQKLTEEAFLQVLEIFYLKDQLRAHIQTQVGGPFALVDGATLQLEIGGQEVELVFQEDQFAIMSSARSQEVAAAITLQFQTRGLKAWAETFLDPVTGLDTVRIFDPRKGTSSLIRVLGGTAQAVLRFPEERLTLAGSAGVDLGENWAVTEPRIGVMALQIVNSGLVDLSSVIPGDYVLVQGTNFATDNRGSFKVLNVDIRNVAGDLYQTVEVEHLEAVFPQGSVTIAATTDLLFFRRHTATSSGATVAHARPGTVDVLLPATAPAVARSEGLAAYLQTPAEVEDLIIISRYPSGLCKALTATNHGLQVGDLIQIQDFIPNADPPTGTISAPPALPASPTTIFAQASAIGIPVFGPRSILLNDGVTVFTTGGVTLAPAPGVARRWTTTGVTILADESIQYQESTPATANGPYSAIFSGISRLYDGRVLQTGGQAAVATAPLSTVACYDPGANTWSSPSGMAFGRSRHFQISLPDGRVLVGGGTGIGPSVLSSCEIFTYNGSGGGTWAATASMSEALVGMAAVLLQDGRVLVCGGNSNATFALFSYTSPTNTCQIFDPATNTWSSAARMNLLRTCHTATVLPDGRVLVLGGACASPSDPTTLFASNQGEIWDPVSNRWSPIRCPGRGGPWRMSVLLGNKVLSLGGVSLTSPLSFANAFTEAWLLDLETMRWTQTANMPTSACFGQLVARDDGTAFLEASLDVSTSGLTGYDQLYVPNAEQFQAGGMTGEHRLTAVTSTTFSWQSPIHQYTTWNFFRSAPPTVTRVKAQDRTHKGPYLSDPLGITIYAASSTSTSDLLAGRSNANLDLTDASDFPDEGYVILDYGGAPQGPIHYSSKVGNTLRLDASFRPTASVQAGANVSLCSRTGFQPEANTFPGAFYITGSALGRLAAEAILDDIAAAGLAMDKTILYPGDRGLAGEGRPTEGTDKLSDQVQIWGGDDLDTELATAREGV